ncbi:MAG TPA: rhodanese-like domain-containing protein [Anaerolineae bacterium]|nr:rhodanese-like domain-containing protein [Anaerolineae bacterium]
MRLIDKLKALVKTSLRPRESYVAKPSTKADIRPSGEDWTQSTVMEMTVAEFNEARRDQYLNLVDCRETMEWKQERIPGSINVPMNQTPGRLKDVDKEALLVIYSNKGERSYSVAQYLADAGYEVKSLQGGLEAWKASGGPLESDYHYDNK